MFAGCATTRAVAEAPEEFWITVESIVAALWSDLESVLLVLGI